MKEEKKDGIKYFSLQVKSSDVEMILNVVVVVSNLVKLKKKG